MYNLISYADVPAEDKYNKALDDCRDHWGVDKFNQIVRLFREADKQYSFKMFTNFISLSGISGYPVKALYEYVYGSKS